MTELDPEMLIDEIIASKEMLGRPKDTAALPALYATREALRRRRDAEDKSSY